MEPPRSLEELQNFLDTGGNVNFCFPALFGTGSWTLLQRATFTGTPDMVSLLLERGASMEYLAEDSKSAVDLAGDAENWDSFELLRSAADNQYRYTKAPHLLIGASPVRFFPSEFFVKLRDPFEEQVRDLNSKEYKDMIHHTREVNAAGKLSELVPYPDENKHLIVPYQQAIGVASMLQQKGRTVERALAYAGFWLYRCLKYHSCSEARLLSEVLWRILPKRIVDVSQLDQGLIKLVAGRLRRSPYCAVSYRWQDPAVKTTAESITAFSREITLNTLQTQLRDACLIANRLGIRYVWIDALCIIQKSEAGPGDFDEEAPKMASVYGNATFTLAFTDNIRFGMVEPQHKAHSRELGDLDTRGWALQEQVLSERVLYITRTGLFWECLDGSMSESCPCGIPKPTDLFRAADDRNLKKYILQKELPLEAREGLMCMWRRNIVEEYSGRYLTYEEDRLVAAASITTKLATRLNDECKIITHKNTLPAPSP